MPRDKKKETSPPPVAAPPPKKQSTPQGPTRQEAPKKPAPPKKGASATVSKTIAQTATKGLGTSGAIGAAISAATDVGIDPEYAQTKKRFGKHKKSPLHKLIQHTGKLPETVKEEKKSGFNLESFNEKAGKVNDKIQTVLGEDNPISKLSDAICEALDTITNIFNIFSKVKDAIKGGKAERLALADELLDKAWSYSVKILDKTGVLDKLPIVGAIIGAVSAIMEFIPHVRSVYEAAKGVKNVGKLKSEEKEKLTATGKFNTMKRGKVKFDKTKAATRRVQLAAEIANAGKTKMPAKELDAKKEELTELDEFFLNREIKHADKKRVRQGAMDITADVINFAASLCQIEPEVGAAIGAGLKGMVTVGKAVHGVISFGVHTYKNWNSDKETGAKKFLSKSDKGKEMRRGALGEHMVGKLVDLSGEDLDSINENEPASKSKVTSLTTSYDNIEKQIQGMGIFYAVLMRSKSREKMADSFAGSMSREGDDDSKRGIISSFVPGAL